jgi:hypothetical protein
MAPTYERAAAELEPDYRLLKVTRGTNTSSSCAGAAPRSPEIYDRRNIIARDVTLEGCCIGGDRLPREQLLVASSTLGMQCRPLGRDPVNSGAWRVYNVNG